MDAFEKIAGYAQFSCAVLGNHLTGEYMLVDLAQDGLPIREGDVMKARLKNFPFAGVFGFKNGEAGCACEPGPEALRIMCAAAPAFVTYLAEKLRATTPAVDWLERLHAMPDTRDN